MALSARHAADEEARAEVDVLMSRLDKTTQLSKKIQASLTRLQTSGKLVEEAIGPIYGKTQILQVQGRNIDAILTSIEKVRQPSDIKNSEEDIIRSGPDAAGLSQYLGSLNRVNRAISELKATNMKSNQQALMELNRLVQVGNHQLETVFKRIIQEDAAAVEPLNFITKGKSWPLIPPEKASKLSLINNCIAASGRQSASDLGQTAPETSTSQIYVKIRGLYLQTSLANLASASVNTAKKSNPTSIYKQGSNGIGMYSQALEGALIAEYDNVCALFPRDEWHRVFRQTTGPSMDDMANAMKELDAHIQKHITTDCFLAFEIVDIIFNLTNRLEKRTGELKERVTTAGRPVKDTAKAAILALLEDVKKQIQSAPMTEKDVAPLAATTSTMQRLLAMLDYLQPLSSVFISLGKDGWKKPNNASTSSTTLSLANFDVKADGKDLFAMYAVDTIDTLINALQAKGSSVLKTRQLQGVFLANNLLHIRRNLRDSDLGPMLQPRLGMLETWKKKATSLYLDPWNEVSRTLMDVQHTSGPKTRSGNRPASSGTTDSSTIVKSLSSKEKDTIKEKFRMFNQTFDELVAKHRSIAMEKEVRESLARDIGALIEPLYGRFYDRYYEVDKGKGKYVKFDKAGLTQILEGLQKS